MNIYQLLLLLINKEFYSTKGEIGIKKGLFSNSSILLGNAGL